MVTKRATAQFLSEIEQKCDKRKNEILNSREVVEASGNVYYLSGDGDDSADGLTPNTAWKSVAKINEFKLNEGDVVRFKRGDVFRGTVVAQKGVTYTAYGEGEKPRLYGYEFNLADKKYWELVDEKNNIYKYTSKITDCGILVFNDGESWSYKHIPSYDGEKFVCRNDWDKPFVIENEMTDDLDIYWEYTDGIFEKKATKGEDFSIPKISDDSLGNLYLRCDKGNPGEVFSSIEVAPRRSGFKVQTNGVTIDNICIKYFGYHGVAGYGYSIDDLTVKNCEIAWIGGTIQDYSGTDLNFVKGRHGEATRLGNGVEIYGGAKNYTVENCYIYQIYDAGATHQIMTDGKKYVYDGVLYKNNLIENCTYSIEYFIKMTDGDTESYMQNVVMTGNYLRFAGYGWGRQRHNKNTPAHIKGWSFQNFAHDYSITGNLFDRSTHRLLHLVSLKDEYCPRLNGNVFVQKAGGILGQYGGNEAVEPKIEFYDEYLHEKIRDIFKDKNAEIYVID